MSKTAQEALVTMVDMAKSAQQLNWGEEELASPHAQPDKARRVRHMFDAIAPTYERINRWASGGRDACWRREMVRLAEVRADDVLLDIACGTGDVMRAFASGLDDGPRPRRIIGLDFAWEMLRLSAARPVEAGCLTQADALKLPLADATASIVTCAFGVRNFQDLDVGLGEMFRVLKPGGRLVILEFSIPRSTLFRHLYFFYARQVMPRLASLVSRDRTGAYRYLPSSVVSFSGREEIVARLGAVGFAETAVHPLTWGVVSVYVARRPK